MSSRPQVGIDIGWSENQRSCGVALRNCTLPLPAELHVRSYGNNPSLRATRMYLSELIDCVRDWRLKHKDELAGAVVVFDGPLGPHGAPQSNRKVDSQFCSGNFQWRAQPFPIEHPGTAPYIEATYKVVEALTGSGSYPAQTSGELAGAGLVIAETHPTIALATMCERFPLSELPTRLRPVRVDDTLIRAKSDFYWRKGANVAVSRCLCQQAARETDHELVAALTCAMMAAQLSEDSADGSRAMPYGDPNEGVYYLPARWHPSWKDCREDQRPDATPNTPRKPGTQPTLRSSPQAPPPAADSEMVEDDHEGGNNVSLVLNDNGGVWEKHNPWLGAQGRSDVCFEFGPNGVKGKFSRAGGFGQWTSTPRPLQIARKTGWNGLHLSLDNPCAMRVRLTPC